MQFVVMDRNFKTGPDLSGKVSPSEPESYADSNSWIRIKMQLRLKDKQVITQSFAFSFHFLSCIAKLNRRSNPN